MLLLVLTGACLQAAEPYRQTFDTLEGYRVRRGYNSGGMKFGLDRDLKREGQASLKVTFRTRQITNYGGCLVEVPFSTFDARDCELRMWLRFDTPESSEFHVALVDEAGQRAEMWAVGYGVAGETTWRELVLRQGRDPGSHVWKHVKAGSVGDVPGNIRKIQSVVITLIAHGKERPGNFHVDLLQVTPARTALAPVGSFDPKKPAVEQIRGPSRVWVTFKPLQNIGSGWRL